MGYIRDEVVVVVLWNPNDVAKVREFVALLPDPWCALFAIVPAVVNGGSTVVMGSDGSKEGWLESDNGDAHREAFLALVATLGGRGAHVSLPEDGPAEVIETPSKYDNERSWMPGYVPERGCA